MTNNEKKLHQRLEKLEELLAHQSLSLDEMSGEVLRLREDHADLARRHKALVNRLEEFEDAAGGSASPLQEKPPHY